MSWYELAGAVVIIWFAGCLAYVWYQWTTQKRDGWMPGIDDEEGE